MELIVQGAALAAVTASGTLFLDLLCDDESPSLNLIRSANLSEIFLGGTLLVFATQIAFWAQGLPFLRTGAALCLACLGILLMVRGQQCFRSPRTITSVKRDALHRLAKIWNWSWIAIGVGGSLVVYHPNASDLPWLLLIGGCLFASATVIDTLFALAEMEPR